VQKTDESGRDSPAEVLMMMLGLSEDLGGVLGDLLPEDSVFLDLGRAAEEVSAEVPLDHPRRAVPGHEEPLREEG